MVGSPQLLPVQGHLGNARKSQTGTSHVKQLLLGDAELCPAGIRWDAIYFILKKPLLSINSTN